MVEDRDSRNVTNEATAPPLVGAASVGRGSPDPALSPTEGLLIDQTATNEATALPLDGLGSPDPASAGAWARAPAPALGPTDGLPTPEDTTNEATAPPLTGSGSPSPTVTEGPPPVFTDHRPLTTDHSPTKNEAIAPAEPPPVTTDHGPRTADQTAEDAVRSVHVPPAVVAGLLALLFCPASPRPSSRLARYSSAGRDSGSGDRNVRDLRAISPGGLTRPFRTAEIAVHASSNRRNPGVPGRVTPAESRI